MNQVTASLIAFAFLVLPGLALYRLLELKKNRFAVSLGLGASLLAATQVPVRLSGTSVQAWLLLIMTFTVITLAYYIVKPGGSRQHVVYPNHRSSGVSILVSLALVVAYLLYTASVGGYTEVPSDFWNHLERIRWEINSQSRDALIPYHFSFSGLANRDYVHALHALVTSQLGISRLDLVNTSGVVVVVLFLLSTFWFAYGLCEGAGFTDSRKALVAALTIVLLVLWKGTTVFSFVRYYAMAPVMLGFVVYQAFLLVCLDVIRGEKGMLANMVCLVFFAVAMLLIHQQELAFGIVMAATMLVVYFLTNPQARSGKQGVVRLGVIVIGCAAAVVGSVLLVVYKEPGSIVGSKLLYLGGFVPFFEDVFVLNPARQFYMVMGWFGVAGLVIAVYRIDVIKNSTFLIAGLLVPLITVFNPIFVYVYLHAAKYETLWRLLFMVPLSLILARVMVDFLYRFESYDRRSRILGAMVVVVMTYLLTPMQIAGYRNTNSRLGTLVDTREQGVEWIRDVIQFLDQMPGQSIYTDPVTSYVLRGATDHFVRGWKFYPGRSGYDFVELERENKLQRFVTNNKGIYVVNRRDTGNTLNGKLSGHWYDDVLTTSKWYPDELADQLKSAGSERIFAENGIEIHRLE